MPLSLDDALARIPAWAAATELETSYLAGGITNKNYRVNVDGQAYVLRLVGANTEQLGIDRRHEYAATQAAAAAGVAPEVVYYIEPEGCLVTRFIAGRPVAPDEMRQPDTIRLVAAALRRVHALPPIPGNFSPFHMVAAYRQLALDHGVTDFPANFDWLLARLQAVEAAFQVAPTATCPCHNDLLNENFLIENDTGRMVILDWEYAGMGDPHFDLGNVAAQHAFGDEHDRLLLESYFGTVTPQAWARHKLMKCLSDFREATWGLAQLGVSTLDFDFLGYAGRYFTSLNTGFSDPRVEGWLRA